MAAWLATCAAACAQDYPARPVRLLVGFASGGAVDTVARLLQPRLARALGTEIIVENRPGAAGVLAAQAAANAAPDGYTILLVNHAALVIAPAMGTVAYDPLRDFSLISRVVEVQNIFLAAASLPIRDLESLARLARASPGSLNYATSGNGSAGHLAAELFARAAGIDWVHVPYRGGGPAMTDFLAGRVQIFVATPATAISYIKEGKARALAVSGSARARALPEVPTVAESGWPGFEATAWFALVGPGRLPRHIVERWHGEVSALLASSEVRSALSERGMDAFPGSPEELDRYLRREQAKWTPLVKSLGLRSN